MPFKCGGVKTPPYNLRECLARPANGIPHHGGPDISGPYGVRDTFSHFSVGRQPHRGALRPSCRRRRMPFPAKL